MQNLIWGLLSGLKFNQLSDRNKSILKLFYPDAEARFGNQAITDVATRIFDEFIPDSIKSQVDYVRDLKSDFLKYQDNFQELESIMAPIESRSPIPLGWIKTEEGYYIKLTNEGSYTNISVEIYVPDDLEVKEDRSPQSLKQLVFAPWKYVALPGSGQRLAMSSKVIKYKGKKEEDLCTKIKSWRSKKCREFTTNDREKIIQISDPKNFPHTRYASPPDITKPIEVETDCSHFINEIYRRVGIDFPYVPTSLMRCLKYFKEVSNEEAKPGDLILYPKHVGILNKNGKIINSRVGGRQRLSTRHYGEEGFVPSIAELELSSFGKPTFYKWSCP
jgi:cell wall-associated NlpC family hydrolase